MKIEAEEMAVRRLLYLLPLPEVAVVPAARVKHRSPVLCSG